MWSGRLVTRGLSESPYMSVDVPRRNQRSTGKIQSELHGKAHLLVHHPFHLAVTGWLPETPKRTKDSGGPQLKFTAALQGVGPGRLRNIRAKPRPYQLGEPCILRCHADVPGTWRHGARIPKNKSDLRVGICIRACSSIRSGASAQVPAAGWTPEMSAGSASTASPGTLHGRLTPFFFQEHDQPSWIKLVQGIIQSQTGRIKLLLAGFPALRLAPVLLSGENYDAACLTPKVLARRRSSAALHDETLRSFSCLLFPRETPVFCAAPRFVSLVRSPFL